MPGEVKGKAWKFARPYHGPYRLLSLTPTNAEVRLVDRSSKKSKFVPLDRVRSCYPEMTDTVWTGHRLKRRCKPTSKAAKPARAAMQRDAPVRTGPVTRSTASRTSEH